MYKSSLTDQRCYSGTVYSIKQQNNLKSKGILYRTAAYYTASMLCREAALHISSILHRTAAVCIKRSVFYRAAAYSTERQRVVAAYFIEQQQSHSIDSSILYRAAAYSIEQQYTL